MYFQPGGQNPSEGHEEYVDRLHDGETQSWAYGDEQALRGAKHGKSWNGSGYR